MSRSCRLARAVIAVLLGLCVRGAFGAGSDGPVAPSTSRAASSQGCLACHEGSRGGFSPGHAFGASACTACHGGSAAASTEAEAHSGLIAFPGNLSNADRTCGQCHAEHVDAVRASPMATAAGLVSVTRRVLHELASPAPPGVAGLGHAPVDSLLRKLCAGCHLSQDKTEHALDPVRDRGGGCLACHVEAYTAGTHPSLSARVSDARCFGCHARSLRVALSYAGIAEVDDEALGRSEPSGLGRLDDGRLVESRPPDVHFRAGLGCVDCHTGRGLMGMGGPGAGVDIACRDCHDATGPTIGRDEWPSALASRLALLPFPVAPDQRFRVTRRLGSPLGHLEIGAGAVRLHRKLTGGAVGVPLMSEASHPLAREHRRLSCDACHSQWAPQCYGCHVSYDPTQPQWDHASRQVTAGRWSEQRSRVRNTLPPLGVGGDGRIRAAIPGMILTLDHPALESRLFRRRFAVVSPHTVGRARDCASCHRSAVALGLGTGRLREADGMWSFEPGTALLRDGLSSDAWTGLDVPREAAPPAGGARPFDGRELRRILGVHLPNGTVHADPGPQQ